MNKPPVYRPNKNEDNPNVQHYGAPTIHDMDKYLKHGFDYPVSGDTIAHKQVRPSPDNLPPVGNKTAVYRLTRINGDYTLDLNKGAALRFISKKPFNDHFITYSLLKDK